MSDYVARDVLTVAGVTEDGQSFEDLGIMERKAGQLIIKCQSYEQLPPSQEALERRIDELCAEVERLRKAKDAMHGDAFEIGAMLVKARDENAKLGEQNATLLKLLEDMKNAPCCGNYCWMEIPQRLRDVGIEVPE